MNYIDGEKPSILERTWILPVLVIVLFITAMVINHANTRSNTKMKFQEKYVILEESEDRIDGMMLVADRNTGIVYMANHKVDDVIYITGVVYDKNQLPMKINMESE